MIIVIFHIANIYCAAHSDGLIRLHKIRVVLSRQCSYNLRDYLPRQVAPAAAAEDNDESALAQLVGCTFDLPGKHGV